MHKELPSVLLNGMLEYAHAAEAKLIEQTRRLVECESPSPAKPAVDLLVDYAADLCVSLGGKIKVHAHRDFGNSLEARFGMEISTQPVLLLGHLDTVWDLGTLKVMPWRVTDDQIFGPGVLDMKLGVAMALLAIEMLRDLGALTRPVVLLLHGDEEVGSPSSRPLTEAVAEQCSAVYVLEPAQGETGAYKTTRKGVGNFRFEIRGVGAHSGVDFECGHSAILELGRLLGKIAALTDLERGITLNPGIIGGGTRSNVIAAEAWAEIDVRIARAEDVSVVKKHLQMLQSEDKECVLTCTGDMNRPPMERTAATARLFNRAKGIAKRMNIELLEAATGGGSDGNFTAALGIPTLDGMGAVGAGAHAAHEQVSRRHIASRIALLAAMLR